MRKTPVTCSALLLCVSQALYCISALAQSTDTLNRQQVRALRTDAAPLVGGILADAGWREAERHAEFRQTQPVLAANPSENSYFQLAYDSDNLYVAFRAYDSDPSAVVATEVRRDANME